MWCNVLYCIVMHCCLLSGSLLLPLSFQWIRCRAARQSTCVVRLTQLYIIRQCTAVIKCIAIFLALQV
jgi:hypothetical protein